MKNNEGPPAANHRMDIVSSEDLITQSFVDDLKNSVTWEVANPEENAFQGMTKDSFKKLLMKNIPNEIRSRTTDSDSVSYHLEDRETRGGLRSLPIKFNWKEEWPE